MSADFQEPSAAVDLEKVERQRMTVDIACAGFGPAMGGFLTTLSRSLLNPDGSVRLESATSPGLPLQVICCRSIAAFSWEAALISRSWNSNLQPQRLKPLSKRGAYGAAEAAPLQSKIVMRGSPAPPES